MGPRSPVMQKLYWSGPSADFSTCGWERQSLVLKYELFENLDGDRIYRRVVFIVELEEALRKKCELNREKKKGCIRIGLV